jgi:hypothetical protein
MRLTERCGGVGKVLRPTRPIPGNFCLDSARQRLILADREECAPLPCEKRLAITGATVGLVCALLVSNLMAGALYGIRPTDPGTFSIAIVVFNSGRAPCLLFASVPRDESRSDDRAPVRIANQLRALDF